MMPDEQVGDIKPKRMRSPNHPSLSLKDAVERVGELHKKYGTHPVPIKNAAETLGYSSLNSSAQQSIAALSAYGLVIPSGSGEDRKVAVSPDGTRIVRTAPDRATLIKASATRPAIHQEVLEHYGSSGLPHDDILRNYLLWERPAGSCFTEDAVDGFITRLRDTMAFAGLRVDDMIDDSAEAGTEDEESPSTISIGSFVQWTSGGVDQFNAPLKVSGISEDRKFAFVDGKKTGVPMSQLTLSNPPTQSPGGRDNPPVNPFYVQHRDDTDSPSAAKERMTLDEGPVMVSWPGTLSADSVSDLEAWFAVLVKRLKRKAGLKKSEGENDDRPT